MIFCPLKIKITQGPGGYRLNSSALGGYALQPALLAQ